VEKDSADFEHFRAQFERLSEAQMDKALGERVSGLFDEYRALGRTLMDKKDR